MSRRPVKPPRRREQSVWFKSLRKEMLRSEKPDVFEFLSTESEDDGTVRFHLISTSAENNHAHLILMHCGKKNTLCMSAISLNQF